ncbi:MAG: hypothetical protein C0501_29915 [Isosphaera sp.]|nr:hypothetical protein [Isosphaera sp.]
MTEHDWERCRDPLPMLDEVYPVRSPDSAEEQSRRSRLYLLACGRAAWDRLPGVCRQVVAAGERVYLGRDPDAGFRREVRRLAEELVHCRGSAAAVGAVARKLAGLGVPAPGGAPAAPPGAWAGLAFLAYFPFCPSTPDVRRVPPDLHSADLLREVFGNPPARRPPLRREWLTPVVVDLARCAAAGPDFAVLPVLADALDEAGCDRADVLDHLRGRDRAHVRGCWVLEAVLEGGPARA